MASFAPATAAVRRLFFSTSTKQLILQKPQCLAHQLRPRIPARTLQTVPRRCSSNATTGSTMTAKILAGLAGITACSAVATTLYPSHAEPAREPATILTTAPPSAATKVNDPIPPPPPGWFRSHIKPEVITMGGILGACTGFFAVKLGKLVAFGIGAGFILVQFLVHAGWINVHWADVQHRFDKRLETDQAGNIAPTKLWRLTRATMRWLTADVPFAGGFAAGFALGFRLG
ncbi:FUN14 family-domain-containing protein [Phlyctochytrium arcticum]|nr:FUN14 family-domain-containing protein [Phlyctochytrium arcticum]